MKPLHTLLIGIQIFWMTVLSPMSVPSATGAMTNTIRFERISLKEGLSQATINAILQDDQGYMWFGTEDGLNKYDGYNFTVYKHDSEDSLTLSDNFISAIHEDQNGDLWIGTRSGLDRFDRQTETFIHYQHDPDDPMSLGGTWVSAVYEDRSGRLWVGTTSGLDLLDRDENGFIHYRHDPDDPKTISNDYVRVIAEDQYGELWVGTNGGLNLFDQMNATFIHYLHVPHDLRSLSSDKVNAVFEDREGILWVGTEEGGLNRFNRSKQTFTHYQHKPDNPYGLSHNRVRAILEDEIGRLWIGTQNGLDQLDRNRDRFYHYNHDPGDLHSLSSNSIWSIYEDRTGVLWFGTYGGGLSRYNRSTDRFVLYQHQPDRPNSLSDNMVWSIHLDRQGMLWIGTLNGGLNKLDRNADTFTVYQHDPEDPTSISSNDVRAIIEDHRGQLWVGTNGGGLNLFNPRTDSFRHYMNDPNDPNSISENRVTVILEDRSGNLWIGTRSGGVNYFDRTTGAFVRYRHDPNDPSSLSDDRVWSLYEDSSGKLWVGTLGGVNVLDPSSNRFTRFLHDPDNPHSLSNNAVFSFYQDPTDVVWIGTWGSGLDRFDPVTQLFTHYREKNGLPNDVIYGIEADLEGYLWLSTNKGLSKFDPSTETFRNYDVSDGLQDNEFNVGAHFRSEQGELFFGGIEGFNAFLPDNIKENPYPPPIVITSFAKFNRVERTNLAPGEHIQLSYKDNFISFEFAALDYTAPEKNQYAYKLDGFDDAWVIAGTRRYASYTNLRGGDYIFRVKGSNSDGVWNDEGIAIHITITPPIWETWWFRGIILFVVLASVIGGYRLQTRSIERRRSELESQVKKRTHELEALYRAEERMHRHLHLDQVLQTLVDVAVDMLRADKSSVLVWDEEREKFVMRVARGFSPEAMAELSFARGEGVIGYVASSGEPVIVEDVLADPRREGERAEILQATDAEGIRSLMQLPLKIDSDVFGIFNVSFTEPHAFTNDERRLFLTLTQRAALAIENAQLYERAQELAVVEERQRLARDLHDAVTQTLFSASLISEVLPRIWEKDPDYGRGRLEVLRELTRGALAEMRTLLIELRPAAIAEADMIDLLRQLADSIISRARVPVTVEVEGDCALPSEVKVALYRITQEALNNVVKHSEASQATISLNCEAAGAEMIVSDDGRGFDIKSVSPDHLGLGIMRERAEAIGADLQVESQVDRGTQVKVVWRIT